MFTDARSKVLKALAMQGRMKVSDIVGYTELSWRHLDRILPKMESERLVRSSKESNRKIYEITPQGKNYIRSQYEALISEYKNIFDYI
jgi:predicted transcriptional regulator